MASDNKATVVVATYNGAGKIANLLDGLSKQSVLEIEIIIVIDGSTDNTIAVVESFQNKLANLKTITQINGGRSVARNAGARVASSELLIFYDDDMIPEAESVEKHIDFHKFNNGFVCGDIVEVAGEHKTDIQNYKAWLTGTWTNKYHRGLNKMTKDRLFFSAANCSFTRELFWQLDGFDQRLADAEDYELACRALAQGIPVYFDRNNKAVHDESITCKSYIQRLREYSAARSMLKSLSSNESQQQVHGRTIKTCIYRFVSFSFLVRWIDAGLFASILPRKLRFRMYSIIIHALANEHTNVRL